MVSYAYYVSTKTEGEADMTSAAQATSAAPAPTRGKPLTIEDLDTPAMVVDLDRLQANIDELQAYCDAHGLNNRPHIKTHKVTYIAKMQLDAGATGIACQKLGEVEVMVEAGITGDIMLCYNVMGASKLERLRAVSQLTDITLTVDSEYTARGISAYADPNHPINLVVELAMPNFERTGVPTKEDALTLAKTIDKLPGVHFRGLMMYPTTKPEQQETTVAARDYFTQQGMPVEIVSGGGSVDFHNLHKIPHATEVRVGTFNYGDRNTVGNGVMTYAQCAQRIICTVVSKTTQERVILDGGTKTFTSDMPQIGDPRSTFCHIIEYPEARMFAQSEEHGHVDVSQCERTPEIGERVSVIANHACGATNNFDEVAMHRNGEVVANWPIWARGKIR